MVQLPPDLADALDRHEPARVAFGSLPPERQVEWIGFVEGARSRRGRARRVQETVRRLGGWTPALAAAAEDTREQRPVAAPPPPEREWWPWLLLLALLVIAGLLALFFVTRDGDRRASVPSVVGLQERQAVERVDDRGLVARVSRRPSAAPRGTVFRQDPQAGVELDRGDHVQLVVSSAPPRLLVPDVVGLEADAAKQTLSAAGLVPDQQAAFARKKRGTVVEQDPKAGTRLEKGDTVSITVSKGPQRTTVPEVTGLLRAEAEAALKEAGLVANAVQVRSSEPQGTVTAQRPQAGDRVPRGTTVRINVSAGPAGGTTTTTTTTATTTTTTTTATTTTTTTTGTVAVPSVTGLEQTSAIRQLLGAGVRPRVVYVASSRPDNIVVRQSPASGTTVRRGSRVRINVSAGQDPAFAAVPSVVGQTGTAARQTLEQAGFTVVVFRVAGRRGTVVDQQPAAGANAPEGGQVNVFVGR